MADRWFYTHGGSPEGPISHEQLKQLAATGALAPADLVWPEGGDPRRAVEARSVLNFAEIRKTKDTTGNWMGKVAQVLSATPSAPAATPDWLSDVKQSSAVESAPAVPTPSSPPRTKLKKAGPPPRNLSKKFLSLRSCPSRRSRQSAMLCPSSRPCQ